MMGEGSHRNLEAAGEGVQAPDFQVWSFQGSQPQVPVSLGEATLECSL